jgi:CubicO group peptidase (beta-lactamase class C family)
MKTGKVALILAVTALAASLFPHGLRGQEGHLGRSESPAPALGGPTGPVDPVEFGDFVDEFFEGELADSHIPGAVFLMVKDGEVFYARGYGFADLESGIRVDPRRTVFRVGSNSKTLTAAAVLTLVEEGRVELDADVNEYLDQVRIPATFPEPVTLRRLLTHTAGFDERLFGQHARSRDRALSLGEYLATHLTPRTAPPGEVISYNDHGASLAGLVIEDVTGQPFAEYMEERIFSPLGMGHSSFDVANLPPHIGDNLATAYRFWSGEHTPYEYDYIQTAPAAGLVTTAADMGSFLAALLGGGWWGGNRILSDSMTTVMLDRQFAHSPRLRGRAFGFVESDENGVRALSKDGQATGFLSRIFLIPEAGIGFFTSINLSIFDPGPSFNRASSFHRRLTTAILDRYFMPDSAYFDLPEAPAPDPAFDASPYVGTYRSMEGSRHTIEKITFTGNETAVRDWGDGTLLVGPSRWVEMEPGQFQYAEGGPYYVAFALNDGGRATHLFIGAGALERVRWYDTARALMAVSAGSALLFLSALVGWPFAGWVARRHNRPPGSRHPGRWTLLTAAAVGLAFLVGFGWSFSQTDFQEFFKGIPPAMSLILALPIIAVPLTLLAAVHSLRAWWAGLGSLAGRIHFSLVTAGLVVFLLLLNNWHMLGWRY